MMLITIIGPLCAGKSTASTIFEDAFTYADKGCVVVSLDAIGHQVLRDDECVKEDLVCEFGQDILDPEGRIIRSVLAECAFSSDLRAQTLNAITHPAILQVARKHIESTEEGIVVILESPLPLSEDEHPWLAGRTSFAVIAPAGLRKERAIAKGIAGKDAEQRMACQPSVDEYIEASDYVIDNSGSRESLCESVYEVLFRSGLLEKQQTESDICMKGVEAHE